MLNLCLDQNPEIMDELDQRRHLLGVGALKWPSHIPSLYTCTGALRTDYNSGGGGVQVGAGKRVLRSLIVMFSLHACNAYRPIN